MRLIRYGIEAMSKNVSAISKAIEMNSKSLDKGVFMKESKGKK